MATVGNFIRAANTAIVDRGELRLRRSDDPSQGFQVDVTGTSRWSRFVRKFGARDDRHMAVTQAFGRAVRREYGEQFFRKLPSGLRSELDTGMSRWLGSVRNSKKTIHAVEPYLNAHKETIQGGVSKNQATLDSYVKQLESRLQTLGGPAYAQFAPGGDAERGQIHHELSQSLDRYLKPDFKKEEMEVLGDRDLDEAVRKLMSGRLAEKGARMPESDKGQTGAHALSQLAKTPIAANAISSLPSYNKTFSPDDVGRVFGRYVVHDRKKLGVEPGFVALKVWTRDDTDRMLDLSNAKPHRYAMAATAAYLECLDDKELIDLARERGSAEVATLLSNRDPEDSDAVTAQHLRTLFREQPALRIWLLRSTFASIRKDLAQNEGRLPPRRQQQFEVMKSLVQHQTEKFTKRHYVKLDYHERTLPNRLKPWGATKYARGARSGLGVTKKAVDIGVRWWKSDTPKGLNGSAVKEALANDLTRALGVPTQKLKLVASTFPGNTGEVKLLLDGTHVTGSTPDESYSDLTPYMSGHGERQVLVKTRTELDPRGARTLAPATNTGEGGVKIMEADTSRTGMGRYKAVFSLLADVDAVGSQGQNKGTVGKQFFAIDPGHSLDEGSMLGEIPESDFRIKSEGHGSYKNFAVFDQSPFSERMRGLKDTLDRVDGQEVRQLFESYKEQFGDNAASDELRFKADIEHWNALLDARVVRFREKFADRLAVYGFDMSPALSGANAGDAIKQRETACDQVLDSLDALEKISSRHSWVQEWKAKERGRTQRYQLKLAYPEVKSADRQAWTVTQGKSVADRDSLIFTMVGSNAQATRRFDAFLGKTQPNGLPAGWKQSREHNGITLKVPKSDIGKFNELFNLDRLSQADGYVRPGLSDMVDSDKVTNAVTAASRTIESRSIDREDAVARAETRSYIQNQLVTPDPRTGISVVYDPPADGHCGYHALAYVSGSQSPEHSTEQKLQSAHDERRNLLAWYDQAMANGPRDQGTWRRVQTAFTALAGHDWDQYFDTIRSRIDGGLDKPTADSAAWADEAVLRLKALASGQSVIVVSTSGIESYHSDGTRSFEKVTGELSADQASIRGQVIDAWQRNPDQPPLMLLHLGDDHFRGVQLQALQP